MKARDLGRRIESELQDYRNVTKVHDLPESQSYIANRYLAPLLKERLGFSSYPELVHARIVSRRIGRSSSELVVASIGAGNCELEIELARTHGCKVECYELSPDMLKRAGASAREKGVEHLVTLIDADLNTATLRGPYDVVVAEHSLHHIVELEHLFREVDRALRPDGVFIVNDMIGRNGHLFYPATLDMVNRIWSTLPRSLKLDRQRNQYFPRRVQIDFSRTGFEGIRAQDVLPLLDRQFNFETFGTFYAFATKFVDRDFGHNFEAQNPLHGAILDHIWHQDHLCLTRQILRPTQMIASLLKKGTSVETRYTYFETAQAIAEVGDERFYEEYERIPPLVRATQAVMGLPAAVRSLGLANVVRSAYKSSFS